MLQLDSFRQLLLDQLARAEGLTALVETAGAFLGLPFAVCDAAYTLLATAAPRQEDGVFAVQSSRRQVMRPEIVEEMQQKGIVARLQTQREAFSLFNTAAGQWEVFCALGHQKQVTGYLFVRLSAPPSAAELEGWTALGQALSVELARGEYATAGPLQPVQAGILRQLIEGQFSQEELLLQRLRQTGWKPSDRYRVGCLVCLDSPLFSSLRHEQLLAQLRDLLPEGLCCPGREQVVLLLPELPAPPMRLLHWLRYHQFFLTLSAPFPALLEAPDAYAQTQTLVQALVRSAQAKAPRPAGPFLRFEDAFPLACFVLSQPFSQLESCLHPHIQLFLRQDRTRRTQYLPTLRAYFAHNRSTTEAAAALFIHKTTLFYRLEQMEKLVGPFLKDPKLLFLYEYSLLLLDALAPGGDALSTPAALW